MFIGSYPWRVKEMNTVDLVKNFHKDLKKIISYKLEDKGV